MSLYIMKINELSERDLLDAANISKSNRILLITGSDGMMPCSFFSYLSELQVVPEFFQIDEPSDEFDEGLFIGMMVSGYRGDVNLIFKNEYEQYKKLNGNQYEGNGQINIRIYKSIAECIGNRELNVMQPVSMVNEIENEDNVTTGSIENYNSDLEENMIPSEAFESFDDEESFFSDSEIEFNDDFVEKIVSETVDGEEIPQEFGMALERIDIQRIGLIEKKDEIAKAIISSTPNVMSTLQFQLQMRLHEDNQEKLNSIYKVISGEYDLLRRLLCA